LGISGFSIGEVRLGGRTTKPFGDAFKVELCKDVVELFDLDDWVNSGMWIMCVRTQVIVP